MRSTIVRGSRVSVDNTCNGEGMGLVAEEGDDANDSEECMRSSQCTSTKKTLNHSGCGGIQYYCQNVQNERRVE
jgi:hypothetical protein